MLANYLKVALRHLRRQKGYAFISLAGLAVGMGCAALILGYVRLEQSFDRFHENADRIVRIVQQQPGNSFMGSDRFAITPAPLGPALREEAPEVEAATTLSMSRSTLIVQGEQRFLEDGLWADDGFFDVFSFPLVHGDPLAALAQPDGVVLTETFAQAVFGETHPVGQPLQLSIGDSLGAYTVTGVTADVPVTSHLQFTFVRSIESSPRFSESSEEWGTSGWYTFATLRPAATREAFEQSLSSIFETYRENEEGETPPRIYAEPLTAIHLHSNNAFDVGGQGDVRLVALFSAIALVILLLACVNYTNLAIARSTQRAREVGMRKVSGASRVQIVAQNLTESVLTALVALGAGLLLARTALPLFASWMERDLSGIFNAPALLTLLAIAVAVGLVAGAYPAFVLTAMQPARVLKGQEVLPSGRIRLRSALVVGQYAAALVLVIGSLVIYQQLAFIQDRPLGFDREHVVTLSTRDLDADGLPAFKQEVARLPGVVGVTASSYLPTTIGASMTVEAWTGHPEGSGEGVEMYLTQADADFFGVYDMQVVAGRGFSPAFPADTAGAVVLNETAVAAFGWTPETAIGKTIEKGGESTVVGVVQDFHMHSMHLPIAPLMVQPAETWINYLSIRVRPEGLTATLEAIGQAWKATSAYPFEYAFLDERFDELYADDRRLGEGVITFTIVALFIACLGLFGLAAFTAERRTKEIGIRKALGASVADLVGLLSKDFFKLVAVAFVMAMPVAYLLMRRWLEGFTYRIELGPGLFLAAGVLAVAIALMSVVGQTLRAATTNPVKALRCE